MIDKKRQRRRDSGAPKGYLADWLVVAVAGGAATLVMLLQHV